METEPTYDCAVIGGGLSGLCLAIQLAGHGRRVIVCEKNGFPMHKVCGEYISMESYGFLQGLGLPLDDWQLPRISRLGVSSEQGFMLEAPLGLGGFGISRYTLDEALYQLALQRGVKVLTSCKVQRVDTKAGDTSIETTQGSYTARLVCGSYGKYTPAFMKAHEDYQPDEPGRNYIGVKYHIQTALAPDRIELHNFQDGYCGISKVDRDWYCLCYLSASENLRRAGNDLAVMEQKILCRNPHLKRYFTESHFVRAEPLSISNIRFREKQTYSGGMFLLGDAAGTISPLCGNGMSMGMRASQLLANAMEAHFRGDVTHQQLVEEYQLAWKRNFHARIQAGYYLQSVFGKRRATHAALKALTLFPGLTRKLISLTHGQPF